MMRLFVYEPLTTIHKLAEPIRVTPPEFSYVDKGRAITVDRFPMWKNSESYVAAYASGRGYRISGRIINIGNYILMGKIEAYWENLGAQRFSIYVHIIGEGIREERVYMFKPHPRLGYGKLLRTAI